MRVFYKSLIVLAMAAWLLLAVRSTVRPQGKIPVEGLAQKDSAADSAITATHAMGEVVSIDPTAGRLVLRATAGEVSVQLSPDTEYLRIPPGEKSLSKAEKITLADIGVGDRVLARGKVAEDRKSVPARQLIVISKAAIAQKQEREREEWRRRGISGSVAAINPAAREINVTTTTFEGPRPVVIHVAENASFKRYAPNSVKFSDAQPSSLDEIRVGDRVRALGTRTEDGTKLEAEMVVSGSFVVVGGPVRSVDLSRGEVTIENLETKKPVTVAVNQGSMLRRFPPQLAAMLATRLHGTSGEQRPSDAGPRPDRGAPAPGGPGGGARTRMGSGDINEIVERLPAISLNDLKPGELILVSSAAAADLSRVTAIVLAAGVEPLLRQPSAPGVGGQILGLPSGVLNLDIGVP